MEKLLKLKEMINMHKKSSILCFLSLFIFLNSYLVINFFQENLKPVNAYALKDVVGNYTEEIVDVSYGHVEDLVAIGKDVLSDRVSILSTPSLIKNDFNKCVFQLDNYVVEIVFNNPIKLGENDIEVHIQNKDTYYSDEKNVVLFYCKDKNVEIVYGVKCIYKTTINLIDKDAPRITLNKKSVTLSETDTFNAGAYLSNIYDNFDGSIYTYEVKNNTLGKNGDLYVGNHTITYVAKDSSGNSASANLRITVKEKEVKQKYNYVAQTPYAGSIVSEARKYIGSPYVYGANGPYAFDCSGFVQFIYGKAGVYVPRTSGSQAHYGAAIDPNDMSQWRAGDILTFGPAGSEHAAIYTGNGRIIHAINPSYGVIETGVSFYISNQGLYSVRRP